MIQISTVKSLIDFTKVSNLQSMKKIEKPDIIRYTNIPFPNYRYNPKFDVHPSKLIGKEHIPKLPEMDSIFSFNSWQNCSNYLYAIDLFNYNYYWEVHEVLEKLWMTAGKKSPEGIFLQGIIQLAVALLKKSQANSEGLKRLAEKAIPKLHSQSEIYLGIDKDNLILQFNNFCTGIQELPPVIVLDFG